jgi:hypothetical protein
MRCGGLLRVAIVGAALSAAAIGDVSADGPTPTDVGVRSLAFGGAYVAVAEGAAGMFHNPSGLGVQAGVAFFGQTNTSGRDRIKVDPKGATYSWRGWGVGWGNKLSSAETGISDYTYLSMGHRVSPYVALGASAKLWRTHPSTHFQVLGNSPTYDVAALVAPTSAVRIGARVGQIERGGGIADVALGGSWRYRYGIVSTEVDWRDGDWALRGGLEFAPRGWFAIRLGWGDCELSTGAGVRLGNWSLNTSWASVGGDHVVIVGAEMRV